MEEKPLVSIECLVYNHEHYLRDCLNGFVMQKTSFKFEAIVHDDASTDGSAAIIREFAERYPNIIKPIYETVNQYSKHDGSLTTIMTNALIGKYIAICEGDDYWLDPLKLQKQVTFLESNPKYSLCFHKAKVIREKGVNPNSVKGLYENLEQRQYSGQEILATWTIPTASVLYRNIKTDKFPNDKRFIYGDIVLFLWLCDQGNAYCLKGIMSIYRKTMGGVSQYKLPFNDYFNHYKALEEHFGNTYHKTVKKIIVSLYIGKFISGKFGKNSFYVFLHLMKHPKYIVNVICSVFYIIYHYIRFRIFKCKNLK